MKGGFSFCGVDIADIGLEYAPENKDTYVYKPGEANIHEELFDGHHGGYIYGATRQPKEFILRCFYEDTDISKGIMAKAYNLFKIGKSGKLIFKRRPWCYYYATVTSVDSTDMHSYLNGLFVVTMKAYYPFARGYEVNGHLMYNTKTDPYHDEVMANTALLDRAEIVPKTMFDLPDERVILYNPGTEPADVGIVIAGRAGDGITITNLTNGQSCRYVGFDTAQNEEICTDGISGKTIKRTYSETSEQKNLAFLYHDYGFIQLEPAFPILRDLIVSYTNNTVTSTNILYHDEEEKEWYKGKYIALNNTWHKIVECSNKHTLTLLDSAGTGSEITSVVMMNEIEIKQSDGSEITKISFIYKPTFA